MSDNAKGILIIVAIILLAIITGGDVFNGPVVREKNSSDPDSSYSSSNSSTGSSSNNSSSDSTSSNYQDKVKITRVNKPGTLEEYVTLTARLNRGESLTLTGWKLRSAVTGSEIVIGTAANIPIEGIQANQAIVLTDKNSKIIVDQNKSPIGMSFRLNKCIGYLDENDRFDPTLPRDCPLEEDLPALSRTIDDDCLDFIENLPRCESPKSRELDREEELSGSCQRYIETNLNYTACMIKHRNDVDFLLPEWRYYAGKVKILWREERDKIELIDNTGRTVDVYSY